jgi:hypothetical protein
VMDRPKLCDGQTVGRAMDRPRSGDGQAKVG